MEPLTDEARHLRACVRDLAALSALSVAWGRSDPEDIADSLADVLLRILPVDLLYVRLECLAGAAAVEAARTRLGKEADGGSGAIGKALEPVLKLAEEDALLVMPNPAGDGTVRLAVIPIGYEGNCGVLVAGSQERDFPRQTDRLLLTVSANQAAVVLQHKRAEHSLREDEKRKDEFLATLGHELRNPLAPIRNSLEIMRRAGGNPQMLEQARSVMERQIQQMVRLVDDLLDVSRITRDKLQLRQDAIELAEVVESAVETSRPLIEASGHELVVALPPRSILLIGDQTRLAQVFSNLLNNAAKYMEAGGRIWLTAERQGSEVVVSVKDAGAGIPADMLPKIFEMFTQVDQSQDRSQGGLGIGLTLVKRLVGLHGGTVEAHSDGPGRGTEFLVRLPIVEEGPEAQAPQAAEG